MPARRDGSLTTESTAPEEFGPYVVYERLGVGGMATVHRAKKRGIAGFERGVALKRMLPHLADDVEFIQSFVREAKLASLLVHPNIAQIYDFGQVGNVYYIAMEHVDGFDVRKVLRYSNRHKEPLPLPVVLSILCELCDALDHAHTFTDEHGRPQGIVHRDVSPSNLIVAQSGHLKVIDFGIAKANARQLGTESGRVKGKLGYMSPEVVSGRPFGPSSDVFSAGVVAHELLTAHPLFSAKTDYDTLIRIHEAEIPPPSRRNPGVPAALDEVVLAALARDVDRRLPTARAFREALEFVAEQAGIRYSARDVAEWRARIATADDRSFTDRTWASDVGPSLQRAPAEAGGAPRAATMRPAIGTSPQAARPNLLARLAVVVLFAIAAGLAVYQFLLRPEAPPPPPPPPAPAAVLKFIVQPTDAVVEIGGKETGRTLPFETRLDPGVYSIAVRRDGYQRWTTEIALRDGERQTIHVALEPAPADPAPQPAALPAPAPARAAAVDRATAPERAAAVDRATGPERAAPADRGDRTRRFGERAPARPDPEPAPPAREPEPEPEPAPPITRPVEAAVPPPPVIEPPRTAPDPPGPRAPPLVAANTVTKLSGDIPAIRAKVSESSAEVAGKLCIGVDGRVTSAKLFKTLPEIAGELERALLTWRYRPYLGSAGQPSPACFAMSFRVVFKRPD
jgi:serine/threonine protein kinase